MRAQNRISLSFHIVTGIPLLMLLVACASSGLATSPEADALRAKGDDNGAAAVYMREIVADPNDSAARENLALILSEHGNDAAAAEQYQMILRRDPANEDAHREMGKLYLKANQPASAKEEFEKALAADPHDAKAQNGLGIALDMMGNHEAAQAIYKSVLDENEGDLGALSNLAHSYVLAGNYGKAIALLEPHVKDKKATPALRQNLAEAYAMNGMTADAERVGRMDLSPEQVKRNLDYYRARREALGVTPKLYASLGSFPTSALAERRVADVRAKYPAENAGLVINVTPEVKEIGGTPRFSVQATGFMKAAKLKGFCDRLKKAGLFCQPHGL